jgi:hypothetical protein
MESSPDSPSITIPVAGGVTLHAQATEPVIIHQTPAFGHIKSAFKDNLHQKEELLLRNSYLAFGNVNATALIRDFIPPKTSTKSPIT